MSKEIRDHVISIARDIETAFDFDSDGKYATWVEEWFESHETECEHCEKVITDDIHAADAPDGDDVEDAETETHRFIPATYADQPSAFDYLQDALDIEYVVSGDGEYRGARVLVTFGGPNIWINTRTNTVEGAWWMDSHDESFSDNMGLDDTLRELWESAR